MDSATWETSAVSAMTQHVATECGDHRSKGQSSSPAFYSKPADWRTKSSKSSNYRGASPSSNDGAKFRAEISFEESVRTRHVVIGTLPRVSTASRNLGANLVNNAIFDMLRRRKSPARSRTKVVRKDQLPCFWSLYNWVVSLGIPILEWDQHTPSNSLRARGTM